MLEKTLFQIHLRLFRQWKASENRTFPDDLLFVMCFLPLAWPFFFCFCGDAWTMTYTLRTPGGNKIDVTFLWRRWWVVIFDFSTQARSPFPSSCHASPLSCSTLVLRPRGASLQSRIAHTHTHTPTGYPQTHTHTSRTRTPTQTATIASGGRGLVVIILRLCFAPLLLPLFFVVLFLIYAQFNLRFLFYLPLIIYCLCLLSSFCWHLQIENKKWASSRSLRLRVTWYLWQNKYDKS